MISTLFLYNFLTKCRTLSFATLPKLNFVFRSKPGLHSPHIGLQSAGLGCITILGPVSKILSTNIPNYINMHTIDVIRISLLLALPRRKHNAMILSCNASSCYYQHKIPALFTIPVYDILETVSMVTNYTSSK